jgi:aspartate ammonia-lyase
LCDGDTNRTRCLGERELPADVYWGLQTLRAQENFPISGITEPPVMIEAYVLLKKAAAQANTELGLLPEPIGRRSSKPPTKSCRATCATSSRPTSSIKARALRST